MAAGSIADIRNITFLGHVGAGKTSLAEACLFKAGQTNRLGSVQDGSSILDFTDEEKEKQCSLDTSLAFLEHNGTHINLVDTPGALDFCGPAVAALGGTELGIVVVSAAAGVEVNTRKMFQRARDYGLGILVVINKIDSDNIDLPEVLSSVQELLGAECVPINLPTNGGTAVIDVLKNAEGSADFGDVGEAHTAALEAIVAIDDDLMEKYFAGDVDAAEVGKAAPRAVAERALIPVLFTNARGDVGITELMDAIVELGPDPAQGKRRTMLIDDEETPVDPTSGGAFIGQVIRVSSDPKTNIKYSSIRVHRGQLDHDTTLHSTSGGKGMRPGQVHRTFGGEHPDVDAGIAGDIVSLAKVDVHIGDVLYSDEGGPMALPKLPKPMFSMALEPKKRGEEEKIAVALRKFSEEDPCLKLDRVASTKELVIRGLGELHVRSMLEKMKRYHKVEAETRPPRIPYLETITTRVANVEYTHKKQSGGSGQFGRVIISVEPNERGAGYEFIDKIFGGAIDQAYRPSVDKGIRQQMAEGVLAGYEVVDVKVELNDGKTHPVDSKDIAFQLAGRGAFKEAVARAKPVILEPIVELEVTCPNDNVGDIQGDLASRRGRPQGQESLPGNMALIKATVPLAEVADYHSRLSSITGGQGSYSMELSHYDNVPPNVQQQIIAKSQKSDSGD